MTRDEIVRFAIVNCGRRVLRISDDYSDRLHRDSINKSIVSHGAEARVVGYGAYRSGDNLDYHEMGVIVFVRDSISPYAFIEQNITGFLSEEAGRVMLLRDFVSGQRGWIPFFQPEHLVLEDGSVAQKKENPWPHNCPDCGGPALRMAVTIDCKNRCSPQRVWRR